MRLDHLLSKEKSRGCFVVESSLNISVAIRIGETPVPIPNTMVKTYPAENTAWATVWEGRWLPISIKIIRVVFIATRIKID